MLPHQRFHAYYRCWCRLFDVPAATREVTRVRTRLLLAFVVAGVLMLAGAAPAFAYYESSQTVGPAGTPAWSCPACHGLESGQTSDTPQPRAGMGNGSETGTQVGTRKGPHGGYTTGTSKCELCHVVHGASTGTFLVLRAETVKDLCYTCHDGTGGSGVYGVIQARTGQPPASQHRVETTTGPGGDMIVPGGNQSTGGDATVTFAGAGGSLTCTDCHSPHNTDCVAPFIGDRMRTEDDTNFASIATNHLLKQKPGRAADATVAVTQYGSDWCEACHKGRHAGSTTVLNHPAADTSTAPTWNYGNVQRADGFNSSQATTGPLGSNNFGYVSNPTWRKTAGGQKYPICQQCHEDSRNVGDATPSQITSPATPAEGFLVTTPDGLNANDNPRFQNFPHETENPNQLIEVADDLCLNCHPVANLP
jgi:predicted CXXCH cytochrome family protein